MVQRTEWRRQVEYSLKRNPVTAVLVSAPSVGPSLPSRARDVPGLASEVNDADAKLSGLVEPAQARLPMWDWDLVGVFAAIIWREDYRLGRDAVTHAGRSNGLISAGMEECANSKRY